MTPQNIFASLSNSSVVFSSTIFRPLYCATVHPFRRLTQFPDLLHILPKAPFKPSKMASGAFTDDQLQAISAIVQQAVLPLREASAKKQPATNGFPQSAQTNGVNGYHYTAPEDINNAQDRVKFAYWVPNVSGGLVISKIPQRTKCVHLRSI